METTGKERSGPGIGRRPFLCCENRGDPDAAAWPGLDRGLEGLQEGDEREKRKPGEGPQDRPGSPKSLWAALRVSGPLRSLSECRSRNRIGWKGRGRTGRQEPSAALQFLDEEHHCSNSLGSSSFDWWAGGSGIGSTQVRFSAVRVWRRLDIDLNGAGKRHTHNLHVFCTGPLPHDGESVPVTNISSTVYNAHLRKERVDDPEDSDTAGHGGLVWHGDSRLQ